MPGRDLWNEVEGLLVSQDSPGLVTLFTHDAVYSGPTWRVQGREGIRALFEAYFRAFSDSKSETSMLIEEGDAAIAEWTTWDTQTEPFVTPDGIEIPATGKRVKNSGVSVV